MALEDLGHTFCRRPLASGKDLESYERFAVEEKVKDVMEQMMKIPEAQSLLNEYSEIEFENHLNTLSDNAEEVLERQKRSRTDQVCVFRNNHGNPSLLFIREYKAAHKFVDRIPTSWSASDERTRRCRPATDDSSTSWREVELYDNADRLVAAAVTKLLNG